MQVRMKHQVRSPTVKDSEETNLSAEVLRIGCNGGHGFGHRAKEKVVDHLFVLIGNGGNLFGHRENDMKIGHLQKLGLPVLNPLCSSETLTFWAMSIAAAVEGIPLIAALIAAFEVATQGCRAAHLNCRHDAPLRDGHRRAMFLAIGYTVATEYIRHFQLGSFHRPTRIRNTEE
jgi:hypothetical protein